MKKRLPTSIVILVFTVGFVLLRQFSNLFFDAFALTMMLGSVIEVVRVQKSKTTKLMHGYSMQCHLHCLQFSHLQSKTLYCH